MGAGNPIIRGLDDHYDPTTYFLDFSSVFEDKNKAVKETVEDNDIVFEKLSEKEIDEYFDRMVEWETESFQRDYFFNLDDKEMVANWDEPDDHNRYLSECSASFRGTAVVLARNDDAIILTTDEAESYHYPFGIIPAFMFDDIVEELYEDNIDKQEWYDRRGLDYSERINDLAEKEYDKRLDKWRKKYEPFMHTFHKHWGKVMSVRNGAWMSASIKKIGNDYKFV